jgi:hypothetical protein
MPLASSAARSSIATSSEQAIFFPWDSPEGIFENTTRAEEVGLRFFPVVAGLLIGVRFWMPSQDTTASITVRAWTGGGVPLAAKSASGFMTGGWVRVNFDTPIDLTQGTVYVVSRNIELVNGIAYVPFRKGALLNPVTVGDLTALGDEHNGVFALTPGAFPDVSEASEQSYFVDPIFLRSDAVTGANVAEAFSVQSRVTSLSGTAVGSPTVNAPFADTWYATTPCGATNNNATPITLALGNVAAIQWDFSSAPAGAVMSAASFTIRANTAVVAGTVTLNSPANETWTETGLACNNAPALTSRGTVSIPTLTAGATAVINLTASMMTYLSGRLGAKGSIFITMPNATPTGTVDTKDQAATPFNMPLSYTFTVSF